MWNLSYSVLMMKWWLLKSFPPDVIMVKNELNYNSRDFSQVQNDNLMAVRNRQT